MLICWQVPPRRLLRPTFPRRPLSPFFASALLLQQETVLPLPHMACAWGTVTSLAFSLAGAFGAADAAMAMAAKMMATFEYILKLVGFWFCAKTRRNWIFCFLERVLEVGLWCFDGGKKCLISEIFLMSYTISELTISFRFDCRMVMAISVINHFISICTCALLVVQSCARNLQKSISATI